LVVSRGDYHVVLTTVPLSKKLRLARLGANHKLALLAAFNTADQCAFHHHVRRGR
jgi:hypothetical protein